jgi:SagB-type dehydrogenase family enzyme
MHDIYDATALTPLRVARSSGYIDWASQPSLFKHYPDFLYRIGFDAVDALTPIARARRITSQAEVGGKPYRRLNTPSAGNLHPVELYVQVRGVKGVLSGIYHVDAQREELVLLQECGAEGLEPLLGMAHRFEGFLFILSVVPFRSEWKYGVRAWRYCYMDAGHQLGALCAAQEAAYEVLTGIDSAALNRVMGFDGQEFACAAVAVGAEGDRPAQTPAKPLMRVAPTDYCEGGDTVAGWIDRTETARRPINALGSDADETVRLQRRSARAFSGAAMPADVFEHIMHRLREAPEGMHAYAAVLRGGNAEPGLYGAEGLRKPGAFDETLTALLVDQRFIANAEIVMVVCAQRYDADLQMGAAAFAHALSLDAAARSVGYTAIGAFYDKKLQTFLQTPDYILYVGVFGMER